MRCSGDFIFKSLTKRASGEFKNESGQTVSYDSSYSIKVDEVGDDNSINERKFKFPVSNRALADKFAGFSPYKPIKIVFDVNIYNSGVKLIPVDVLLSDTNNNVDDYDE